jgi:hypothetical protein
LSTFFPRQRPRRKSGRWRIRIIVSLSPMALCARLSAAQGPPAPAIIDYGVQAIGVVTRESPAVSGTDFTEGYLTQPALMLRVAPWHEALIVKSTINFEGLTIKRGELNTGIYGEGYIDRRHPHTYLHELVLTSVKRFGGDSPSGVSLTVGKGFAPFGTDDPMSRPFEKYPVNHHLAQILERAVAIGAVRAGPWIIEGGAFNGDEPTGPGDVPDKNRYWDSWSGRVTFLPWSQAEIQTSYARVKSPENPSGKGADQRKQGASIRLEDAQHSGYALLEWARTGDYIGSTRSFTFTSFLAETWTRYDRVSGGIRIERTERPDEARLTDEFRTPVPATDFSIAGRSRWTIITVGLAANAVSVKGFTVLPFAEVAQARAVATLRPSGFDPRQFYGSDRIWSMSVGVRLAFRMSYMRMGRYGVAVPARPPMMAGMMMDPM